MESLKANWPNIHARINPGSEWRALGQNLRVASTCQSFSLRESRCDRQPETIIQSLMISRDCRGPDTMQTSAGSTRDRRDKANISIKIYVLQGGVGIFKHIYILWFTFYTFDKKILHTCLIWYLRCESKMNWDKGTFDFPGPASEIMKRSPEPPWVFTF